MTPRTGRRGQTIFTVLQRLVPLARRVVWGVGALAIASAVSIVVVVGVVVAHGWPSPPVAALLMIVALFMVPAPVVLWLFRGALREVIELPEWLAASPDLAKGHAAELADLVRTARRPSAPGADDGGRRRGGFVGDTARAGRLLLAAHDDLPGYGAALRLVSPVFLIAVAVAVVIGALQVGLAASMVAADVLYRLVV